jgi:hypothetical protein
VYDVDVISSEEAGNIFESVSVLVPFHLRRLVIFFDSVSRLVPFHLRRLLTNKQVVMTRATIIQEKGDDWKTNFCSPSCKYSTCLNISTSRFTLRCLRFCQKSKPNNLFDNCTKITILTFYGLEFISKCEGNILKLFPLEIFYFSSYLICLEMPSGGHKIVSFHNSHF